MAETRDTGVEANGRNTAMTGIALFVLLAAEGMFPQASVVVDRRS